MKVEIEIPEILAVNFEDPSAELAKFLADLKSILIILSGFRDAKGNQIFSAYLRSGANTVFCTSSDKEMPVEWTAWDGTESGSIGEYSEEDYGQDYEPPVQSVVMEDDKPGSWTVVRLNIPENFVTLRSKDFEGQAKPFKEALEKILKSIKKRAHGVPQTDLSELLKQVSKLCR